MVRNVSFSNASMIILFLNIEDQPITITSSGSMLLTSLHTD